MAKMVFVTWAIFLRSIRSTAWKRSTSGTPYFTQAFWNLKKKSKYAFFSMKVYKPSLYYINWIERRKNSRNFNLANGIFAENDRGRDIVPATRRSSCREWRQVGGKTKAGEKQKRSTLRPTPLYGCSPGRRLELVTRFYCSAANYRGLVINGLCDTRPAGCTTRQWWSLFSVPQKWRVACARLTG